MKCLSKKNLFELFLGLLFIALMLKEQGKNTSKFDEIMRKVALIKPSKPKKNARRKK